MKTMTSTSVDPGSEDIRQFNSAVNHDDVSRTRTIATGQESDDVLEDECAVEREEADEEINTVRDKLLPSSSKHVVITVTRLGPAAEEHEVEAEDGESSSTKGGDSQDAQQDREASQLHKRHLSNNPPAPSSVSRSTFAPRSPADEQLSSLTVERKEVAAAQSKPGARRQGDAKAQGSFLEQLSQFLSRDRKEEKKETDAEAELDDTAENNRREDESPDRHQRREEAPKPPASGAEAAFDAFKAFFTPKPLRKDPAVDRGELEEVRKKIRAEKDVLRAFFERASSKTPEKRTCGGEVGV